MPRPVHTPACAPAEQHAPQLPLAAMPARAVSPVRAAKRRRVAAGADGAPAARGPSKPAASAPGRGGSTAGGAASAGGGPAGSASAIALNGAPVARPQVDYALHRGVGAADALRGRECAQVDVRVRRVDLDAGATAFAARLLWGCDEYTADSDVLCMLQHTGHFVLPRKDPPDVRFDHLLVRLRVRRCIAGSRAFEARERNGIRSRAWPASYDGASMEILSVATVRDGVETLLAKSVLAGMRPYIPLLLRWGVSDASSLSTDVALSFDLLNEPCMCYSVAAVADKGLDSELWPSRRLASGEVMYLESYDRRYELTSVPLVSGEEGDGSDSESVSLRFSRVKAHTMAQLRQASCKFTKPSTSATVKHSRPFPAEDVEVIADSLNWSDLKWAPEGVSINGKFFILRKLSFVRATKKTTETT